MSEQWPVTTPARPALPSLEDLPRAADGYEAGRVEEAFDAFYRHIAQLDATLQTLEAVEAFSRQAGDLRDELRAFRRARWEEGWNEAYGRSTVPAAALRRTSALPRIAAEVAFLIAVAVFLGVGTFRAQTIVAVMAAAWLLVGLVEFFASRPRSRSFEAPVAGDEPAPAVPEPAEDVPGWADDADLTIVSDLETTRGRWRGTDAAEPES